MIASKSLDMLDELVATTRQMLHDEIERNKQEQANRNKPNAEYLRVMGYVS